MSVHHHLDDSTLLRYASGDLDEAFAVIVAAHLAMCPQCRRGLRAAEDVGGALLEEEASVELAAGAVERAMHRLESEAPAKPSWKDALTQPESSGDVPLPLRRYVGASLDAVDWKRVAPGVRRRRIALDTPCGSSLYMLRIDAGKAMPEHGHGGAEMTLVLSGAYRDSLGVFGPGDIADLDEHVEHQPKVEPGAACVCLVATEAPTRFKGMITRLLQPLVGI